jgi:hypothetical protein
MTSSTPEKPPLETALDAFTQALAAWDPDRGGDLGAMLAGLRELQLKFDPRRDRVSAAMCTTGMRLLEELRARGSIGPTAAVAAIGELAHGLRETLSNASPAAAPAIRPGARGPTLTLSAPSTGGLSLSMRTVENQKLGELMLRMNMLTQEQVDAILAAQKAQAEPRSRFGELAVELGFVSQATVESALRLQARGRGETPPPKLAEDPWGGSPL